VVRTRAVLVAVGWLVVAGGTATTATVALNTIGDGILGSSSRARTPEDIRRELAGEPAASPSTPSPAASTPTAVPSTAPPRPTATPPSPRVLSTEGGTVLARCSEDKVTLVSWTPAQGFHADDVARGPALVASVKFKASRTEIRVAVSCVGSEPKATVTRDDRGHDD